MKDSVVVDLDLIFTFIHNVLKIESSRCSDKFYWKYFNYGAKSAETYLRELFTEGYFTFDEIEEIISHYNDDLFNSNTAERHGRLFVTSLFLDSIDFKRGSL